MVEAGSGSHGKAQTFDLTTQPGTSRADGREMRALVKGAELRVTLITLPPGGELPEHVAPGPITVQPLSGRIRFTAGGQDHDLGAGQLLHLEGGIRHRVISPEGGTFLLTVAPGRSDGSPARTGG